MRYVIFLSGLVFLFVFLWHLATDEARTKRLVGLASILLAMLTCGLSLYPLDKNGSPLKLNLDAVRSAFELKAVHLGLDLKGGTAFLIELEGEPTPKALEQAVDVIRKRVDKFGLAEPIIQPTGKNRISVQIPGLTEKEKNSARTQLSKVAKLEFRMVHPENQSLVMQAQLDPTQIPPGYQLLFSKDKNEKGQERMIPYLVKRTTEMSGKHVQRASRGFDELGRPTVNMEFTSAGAKIFGEITEANVNHQMAIVLDEEIKSAPNINGAIYGGHAQISGGSMTPEEAEELSSVLENPLETPVKIVEERGVDPSLGSDSVASGTKALLLATLGVTIFMVAYYRTAGVVAVIALIINLIMLLGLLVQLNFTLTLPGIAGIILTIGMAVDANVLIYERIRDELDKGKPLRAAVNAGFDRAFSAIFDSNITTIIPAVILILMGSGPLQGFAVTLTLGIVANLFAAVVVSRNLFEWLMLNPNFKSLSMMCFVKNPTYNFIKLRWVAVIISTAILLAGGLSLQMKGEKAFGVDFVGGDALSLHYDQMVPVSELRAALESEKISVHLVQYAKAEKMLLLQARFGEGEKAGAVLGARFPQANFHATGQHDSVGSQVGQELQQRAIFALLLGLAGILVYTCFRFEWTYAVAATVGQIHDVLFALGLAVLFNTELTLTLVGAFLTIAGYSINEKIVVFDRVREVIKGSQKIPLFEVLNDSLNLTLARTVITGGTTLIAITMLLLFGGVVIHDFAWTMLVGVLGGMYSSHFIAPAIVWWLDTRKKPEMKPELVGEAKV